MYIFTSVIEAKKIKQDRIMDSTGAGDGMEVWRQNDGREMEWKYRGGMDV